MNHRMPGIAREARTLLRRAAADARGRRFGSMRGFTFLLCAAAYNGQSAERRLCVFSALKLRAADIWSRRSERSEKAKNGRKNEIGRSASVRFDDRERADVRDEFYGA